ncbi:MAG TPA: CheB methylesterase domain-containing protein, partial [Candidatus Manganitrophaceae bacterium]
RTEADKYTPSVDQMMISAAEIYGPGVLGVILTGMGSDGKLGIKTIKEKGGTTFAESEETSVVFGMPKEAIGLGVIDKVLPLHKIADEVIKRCSS